MQIGAGVSGGQQSGSWESERSAKLTSQTNTQTDRGARGENTRKTRREFIPYSLF